MEILSPNKQYSSEKGLVYSCQYHVIFCPKYRRKVLVDKVERRLKELIFDSQESLGYKVLEMEVMPDHVHLLLDSNPKIGINDQIIKLKGLTSRMLRNEFQDLRKRLPCMWTRSKFISTVGAVSLDAVKKYIEDQKNI